MKNGTIDLLIAKELSEVLLKNEADNLIKAIINSREKHAKYCQIPKIHITDEIDTVKSGYEIKISDKTVYAKKFFSDNQDILINDIVNNLIRICKR